MGAAASSVGGPRALRRAVLLARLRAAILVRRVLLLPGSLFLRALFGTGVGAAAPSSAAASPSSAATSPSSAAASSTPTTPPPSCLGSKGEAGAAWPTKKPSPAAEEDAAKSSKDKSKAAAALPHPLFLGRCPLCLWEERVPLWVLFKHPAVCRYRCSSMLREAASRLRRKEVDKMARRRAHVRGRRP